jgi:NTP pyrophosphatase (non-canonical NTP hydrolase)
MKLNEYQDLAMDFAITQDIETNVSHFGFGLCAEAGEVATIFQKYFRGDERYNDPSFWGEDTPVDFNDWDTFTPEARSMVEKELGDVLWHVAALADSFGLSLEDIARTNLQKLSKRKSEGKLKGDGDNR